VKEAKDVKSTNKPASVEQLMKLAGNASIPVNVKV
jgi:hypothetical protein